MEENQTGVKRRRLKRNVDQSQEDISEVKMRDESSPIVVAKTKRSGKLKKKIVQESESENMSPLEPTYEENEELPSLEDESYEIKPKRKGAAKRLKSQNAAEKSQDLAEDDELYASDNSVQNITT